MKKHLKIFSASTFQIVGNQLLGLLFFLLLSSFSEKDIFGEINWSIAVTITISVILTFGFDYIVVRKISAGADKQSIAGTYLFHTVALSAICLLFISIHYFLVPTFYVKHSLFFPICVSTLLSFISGPFKYLAMGCEKFWHLAFMNITSNLIRFFFIITIILTNKFTVPNLGMMFIVSGIIELLLCVFLAYKILNTPLKIVFKLKLYFSLIKESLPQTGTVLLDSAFARMDWILLGIMSTKVFTADYSFSYKAFESSRIPLLIISPILLPKLARIYSNEENINDDKIHQLNSLWKIESVVWAFIPLILNICWVDIVNLFTHNKYGEETKLVYMLLSMGLPMLFINNYLWTIAFAKGHLKLTFIISAIVSVSNIVLNILLIPQFHAIGAAIASTVSIFIQFILYYINVKEKQLKLSLLEFIKTFIIVALIVWCIQYINLFWIWKLSIALFVFILILIPMKFFKNIKSIK